jgi:hypothetical protein
MYRIHYEFLELKQKEAKKFKIILFLIYRYEYAMKEKKNKVPGTLCVILGFRTYFSMVLNLIIKCSGQG